MKMSLVLMIIGTRKYVQITAKDDFKIKDKELKSLKSLGITTVHIVPNEGIFKGTSDLILLNEDFTSINQCNSSSRI